MEFDAGDLGDRLAKVESATTNADKGSALQDFCVYFFGLIPGFEVKYTNVWSHSDAQEIDIVLWNRPHPSGPTADLGQIVFVECKNWSKPVGSAEVAWFDWKLQQGGQTSGFLVASSGISGDPRSRNDAQDVTYLAHANGRRIIVVKPGELAELADAAAFATLVETRLIALATRGESLPR